MGKRIISQRRGKGTTTYRSPSHRFYGEISYRPLDTAEKDSVVYGTVMDLVSCPGHSAPLAKIRYDTKEEVLLSAPLNIRIGDVVASGAAAPIQTGNVVPLKNIPEGSDIYNIELRPGDGGKLVRTAGAFATIVGKVEGRVLIRLPSKKQKEFLGDCRATIGVIAADGMKEKPFLKAGKKWHAMSAKNKLFPRTSAVAMNSVDHPFGSGRGRHIGKPKTPPKYAPPGRKVGQIRARRTGRRR